MSDFANLFEEARQEFADAANGKPSVWNQYWQVAPRYNERHRKYHVASHILDVLSLAELIMMKDFPWKFDLVNPCITAIVWHDAVYIPGSKTNEYDSSVLADAAGFRDRKIIEAIRKTKTHEEPDSILEMIVLDADLMAGLAPDRDQYRTNSSLVRDEYSVFTDEEYYIERKAVLRGSLDRPNIFSTRFASQFEADVRENMEGELADIISKGF